MLRRLLARSGYGLFLRRVLREVIDAGDTLTSAMINELFVLDTYYWPKFDTFAKANIEIVGKLDEATRKLGANIDFKEADV